MKQPDRPTTAPFVLETRNLSRVVSRIRLVDDVSVQIRPSEVLAIVGPSGSGKTSFLRLLNRLDEPTSGAVFFEGRDYREIPPRELRRRVGMVMQRPFLFPGTIAENLRYGPMQQGIVFSDEAVTSLLSQVGLGGRAETDIANLSGGEAQRVSLARALANSPAVLLLDEPTSSLDQSAKEEIENLVLKVVREKALTCLIVSHDLNQAARVAHRVMLLNHGRLEKIGTAAEVIHAEGHV